MSTLLQDARHAFRGLIQTRGFTATAICTLALGIGAVTVMFSLVDAVLLRELPYRDPARLVSLHERRNGVPGASLSAHEALAWRDRNHVFDALAPYLYSSFNLTTGGEPLIARSLSVSANFFDVLGRSATIGRTFAPGEDRAGANRIAVISERLLRQRFVDATKAVGSDILLNGVPHRIVGVMPSAGDLDPDLWVPIDLPLEAQCVGRHSLLAIARLKAGVRVSQAERELNAISEQLARENSDFEAGHGAEVVPLHEEVAGTATRPLLVAAGAVGFVLLIACANVAHLLLTRGVARQKEIAIRAALGATRARLVRFLLVESVILGIIGGGAGVLLAAWLVDLLPSITAVDIPRLSETSVNLRALVVCLAVSLTTGLLCGILPALRGSRASLTPAIGDGSRGSAASPARVSSFLTMSEIALAMMLLVGAALLVQSFIRLSRVDPGFNPEGVLAVPLTLPGSRYARPEQRIRMFEELNTRLAALDHVRAVGGVSYLPLMPGDNRIAFSVEGRTTSSPGDEIRAAIRVVSGEYFRVMQIPLRRGRLFEASDARRAVPLIRWFEQQPFPPGFDEPQPPPVAIVNETLAERFWPDGDAVGRRIRLLYSPWITVVGVIGDLRHASLAQDPWPEIYLTHTQEPQSMLTVTVRTDADPLDRGAATRGVIRALDPDLPLTDMRRMEDVLSTSLGRRRFDALLLGSFSGVAMLLAMIGIYGVTSYSVRQRTREIGIRTALGASRMDVLHVVLGRAMRVAVSGIVAGLAGAYALASLLTALLFGIEPTDPWTFAVVAGALGAMSLLASYIPARHALRIDPLRALRME